MLSYIHSALPPLDIYLFVLPLLFAAYTVFGVAGFGSALTASPLMAQRIPVAEIVPMFALMDCFAVLYNGIKIGSKVARDELLRLVPCMIAGNIVGIWLVLALPPRVMMIVLGSFVSLYAVYTLAAPQVSGRLSRGWIIPSARSAACSARCSAPADFSTRFISAAASKTKTRSARR